MNPEEVDLKRLMADACERVVGIFDHTKWHRNALLTFAPTPRIDGIVTDTLAPAQLVDEWRERDVEVVTAETAAMPAPRLGEVRPTTRTS